MKTLCIFLSLMASINLCQSQAIIDSCFTSPSIGVTFPGTPTLENVNNSDLLEWTGSQWIGQVIAGSVFSPPPFGGVGDRCIFIGDSTTWTSNGESFALLLSDSIKTGQCYSFTFTYLSEGPMSNGSFSPTFYTYDMPSYQGAYMLGNLTTAGTTWFTSTYSFIADSLQNNHTWLIFRSNIGSGVVLAPCAGIPHAGLGNDTTLCAGDSLLLAVSGGATYQWSTGSTSSAIYASAPGTYIVTVTNGCGTVTDSVSVSFQACGAVNAAFYSSDTTFCDKKCIDFTDISTNGPTSWQWLFPGADSTISFEQHPAGICYNSFGTFDVTLIACNSLGCDTLFMPSFIQEFPSPPIPVISANFDTLFCTPAFSYQWFDSGGAIAGATGAYYIYQQPGTYYVLVTDSNGCSTSSTLITTGIHENPAGFNSFIVSPNPSSGSFLISFPGNHQIRRCVIYDLSGRKVYDSGAVGFISPWRLDLSLSADGIYILQAESSKGINRVKIGIIK